jgi:hypothetical protein
MDFAGCLRMFEVAKMLMVSWPVRILFGCRSLKICRVDSALLMESMRDTSCVCRAIGS